MYAKFFEMKLCVKKRVVGFIGNSMEDVLINNCYEYWETRIDISNIITILCRGSVGINFIQIQSQGL